MKNIFFLLLFAWSCLNSCFAQVKWTEDSIPPNNRALQNYSTTYLGSFEISSMNGKPQYTPTIVTAIPYNGMYSNSDQTNTPLDMSMAGSLYRFRSNMGDRSARLNTYDSSEVYFLTPGIYPENTGQYEFRVILDAKTVVKPWSQVKKFTDFALNDFKKGFGFLGGYKTSWDNFFIVELRKKGTDTSFNSTIVYWKQIKPEPGAVYLSKDFNEFLKTLKRPWDRSIKSPGVPVNPVLKPTDNNIIIDIIGDIYKKEALEYSVVKDGTTETDWKANDFDNNFIWLQNLTYGKYTLRIRYAKQRHNITDYTFEVKPFWYQTTLAKIVVDGLIGAFVGMAVVLFRSRNQRKKLLAAQQKREKTETELKAIRSQLNPHFVFNALSSIQGLINTHQIDNANKYLSDFASLMRDTLTGSNKEYNSILQEISTLENYLRLEQLRFHFEYNVKVDTSINTSETEIPALLLQPLVENAVKHGVSALQDKGIIGISFKKNGKNMEVAISDNGKGFDKTNQTNGFGLKLTTDRIRLLNEVTKEQPVLMDTSTINGTTVHLVFQNWLS